MKLLILFWIISILFILSANCGYLREQIIFDINPLQTYCTRLLNGTNEIGCQSSKNGNTGVIIEISNSTEINKIVKQLPLRIENLIVLIDLNNLNDELIEAVRYNQNVQGIILLNRGSLPKKFSEDSACPNQQFSFYKSEQHNCHPWNEKGAISPEGLRFKNFEKPIFLIENSTQIEILIEKCSIPYNKKIKNENLRCIGRMFLFMFAAGNSKLCIERQEKSSGLRDSIMLCDVLEDQNIYVMLPPIAQKQKNVKPDVFVLAARLDSFSSIYNSHGGDISTISSLIPLLLISKSIGNNIESYLSKSLQTSKQLILTFFHGESFGLIGSSRWIYDLKNLKFPPCENNLKLIGDNIKQIEIDNLSFFIELQQIGFQDDLFLHLDKEVYIGNKTMIDNLLNTSIQLTGIKNIKLINPLNLSYNSLPPSSYHSILKESKNIPGFVMASYGEEKYNFSYLNSIFDQEIRRSNKYLFDVYVNRIINSAKIILNMALNYLSLNDTKFIEKFKIDENYAKTLAECFFLKSSWDCSLFLHISNSTNDPNMKYWLKSTANDFSIGTGYPGSGIRKIINSILVNSLGQKSPAINIATQQQCEDQNKKQNVYNYIWQNNPETNNGTCYRTSIYLGMAKSPAFEIQDYNFSSGQYSTWVESRWDSHAKLEIYLTSDYSLEFNALWLAILMFILSAPLYYGLKEQWFIDNSLPPATPQQL